MAIASFCLLQVFAGVIVPIRLIVKVFIGLQHKIHRTCLTPIISSFSTQKPDHAAVFAQAVCLSALLNRIRIIIGYKVQMNFSWLKLIATHRSSKNYLYICSVIFSDYVQRASHGLEVWHENGKIRCLLYNKKLHPTRMKGYEE